MGFKDELGDLSIKVYELQTLEEPEYKRHWYTCCIDSFEFYKIWESPRCFSCSGLFEFIKSICETAEF